MKKSLLLLFAGITGLLPSACTNVAVFDYSTAPGTLIRFAEPGQGKKTIAVLPFMDQRGVKYADPAEKAEASAHPAGDSGSFWIGLIPLLPMGAVQKEEPEKSNEFVSLGYFHFDPSRDLQDAAFTSLKNSGLFEETIRANRPDQAGGADYLWRGTLLRSTYKGSIFTYGVTYFLAPVLWTLGAPYGYSSNGLNLRFDLIDRKTGNTLWTFHSAGSDYLVQWIYARQGQDASLYAKRMKEAMNQALYDLSKKIQTAHPPR